MWECILILLIIDSFWTFITTIYFSLPFFIIFSLYVLLLDRLGCLLFLFFKYIYLKYRHMVSILLVVSLTYKRF